MVHEAGKGPEQFYKYCTLDLSLDFYSQRVVQPLNPMEMHKYEKGIWIYTNEQGLAELEQIGISFTIQKEYYRFPVSRLNGTFLNKNTRARTLKKHYVLEMN